MALPNNKSSDKVISLKIGADTGLAEKQLDEFQIKIQQLTKALNVKQRADGLDTIALQFKAGIKPLEDYRRALAETIGQAKLANKIDPSPVNDSAIARAVISLKELNAAVSVTRKTIAQPAKADFISNIEKQANAGTVPLTKLRDEVTKTAQVVSKPIPANFINNSEIQASTAQVQLLNAELVAVGIESQSLTQKLGSIGSALQSAFLPLAGISAGITALLGSSANDFKGFERTLNTTQAVAQLTADEMEKIKQSSLELGQSTIFNAQDVANSYLELSKAGFTAEQSLKAMPGLLNLAAAAGSDLGVATTAITESLRAFGLGVDDVGRFSDVLAKAANESAVDISDLVESFKQVAPVAGQTKQPLEDVAALLAVLGNNGVKASDAGSDLRNIITLLLKPSKEAAGVLKTLNVSLSDSKGRVKPLSVLFNDLHKALDGYSDSSKAAAATVLAGEQNLKSFLILTGQAPGTINKMVDSLKNAGGTTTEVANTINKGLFASLEQLSGSFDTLKIQLGEALSPAIRGVADSLTRLNEIIAKNKLFAQFAAGALVAVAGITALAAAVSGLLLVLAPLGIALGILGVSFPAVGLAMLGIATVAGLATIALNNTSKAAEVAARSTSQLSDTLDKAADGIVQESSKAQKLAAAYDDLSVKTNKTAAEKKLLSDVVAKLQGQFPNLLGDLKDLGNGYRSLSDEIRNATAQKIAFAEYDAVGKELEKVKRAQADIRSGNTFNRDAAGNKILSNAEVVQYKALQTQEKILIDRKENVSKFTIAKLKEIQANDKKSAAALPDGSGKTLAIGSGKDGAKEIENAQKQLNDKIMALQVELTGFTEGEYAKRREQAKKSYADSVRDIQTLGAKAKLSPSTIQADLTLANQVYQKSLQQIRIDQKNAQTEDNRLTASIIANVGKLRASLTDNPFDDITADQTGSAINQLSAYGKAIDDLKTRLNKGEISPTDATARRTALDAQFKQETAASNKAHADQRRDLKLALDEQTRQNLVSQTELSGDTLKIEQATNAKIISDLNDRITIQAKITKDATDRLSGSFANPQAKLDAQSGASKAKADLDALNVALQKQAQDSALKQAEIETSGIKLVIDQLEKEIELYGQRPELVQKLSFAYQLYLELLQKEASLTGQSAENVASLSKNIKDTTRKQTELKEASSSLGKVLSGLAGLNLGNSGFASFFQSTVSGLTSVNDAFQKFKESAAQGKKGFTDFLTTAGGGRQQIAQLGANLVTSLSGSILKNKTGLSKAIGSAISGALAGALAGSAGGPIGAALGAAIGAVGGAASASGGKFDSKAALVAFAVGGGPLGSLIAGFSVAAKKAAKKQKQLEDTQKFIKQTLAVVNTNDLNSLTTALSKVLRYKSGGGAAFQAQKDAAQQLQQAIDERKKVIDAAVKDFTYQNAALTRSLGELDSTPIKNIGTEFANDLDALIQARDKALDSYKDSLDAQNLIQKNFILQQQALIKDSAGDTIDAIIEAENNIRSYQADAAVSNAQASGNQVAILQANLQAQLVAIDNDTANFKGAEEEKTEFLKAQVAKRNAAIAAANSGIEDLLQQGKDILNQGLVTGTTKADAQKKELQKLFGSLDPLGQIQADGSLVQQTVNFGQGSFQFILDGVQNVEGLIAQLTDPIVQAALRAALNSAIARA